MVKPSFSASVMTAPSRESAFFSGMRISTERARRSGRRERMFFGLMPPAMMTFRTPCFFRKENGLLIWPTLNSW
ncbi:unknown [Akkermansia sp. CAG:344]|nr:unknown [Akkermansia sp. CAG:344]